MSSTDESDYPAISKTVRTDWKVAFARSAFSMSIEVSKTGDSPARGASNGVRMAELILTLIAPDFRSIPTQSTYLRHTLHRP